MRAGRNALAIIDTLLPTRIVGYHIPREESLIRMRSRALVVAVASLAISVGAAAPAQAAPRMAITDLAFSSTAVDATADPQSVALTWRVTNTDQRAIAVTGVVELREFRQGAAFGPVRTLDFALRSGDADIFADWDSTAQNSSYRYEMYIPQYATTDTAEWRVTKATAQDGRGHTVKLNAEELATLGAQFTVTHLADKEGPTVSTVSLNGGDRVYHDGNGLTLDYDVNIEDVGLGFKRGTLVLAGPGGREISTPFEVRKENDWSAYCGENSWVSLPARWANCTVTVPIAAGTPSGAWTVSRVRLVDEAGNVTVNRDVTAPTVYVSRNQTIEAGDFQVTPEFVDNWRAAATAELRFRAQSWGGPIVDVDVETARMCWTGGSEPEFHEDGTVSVGLTIPAGSAGCEITGIALTDESGNMSFYGTVYRAPALDLVVAPKPDDTPPAVLAVRAPKKVWKVSELQNAWGIGFEVQVDNTSGAPVTGGWATLYDSNGHSVGGHGGGYSENPDGWVNMSVSAYAVPGEYVIGFRVTDAAGNSSGFGFPNSSYPAPPGGPLTITVVEG